MFAPSGGGGGQVSRRRVSKFLGYPSENGGQPLGGGGNERPPADTRGDIEPFEASFRDNPRARYLMINRYTFARRLAPLMDASARYHRRPFVI